MVGEATAASGESAGVRGVNQSADGAAGVFENAAGGALLRGLDGSGENFLVDGTGAITANAFILSCDSAQTFYRDADEDTFGDATRNAEACEAPSGYVTDSTDCDDDEAAANPGASEAQGTAACTDAIDNDCDGLVDELDSDCCGGALNTYYRDADIDTYGDPENSISTCEASPPAGYVANNLDCNDEDSSISPEATEACDGIDNDCDGQTDEDNPGGGASCDTGNLGVCSAGTQECQAGSLVCVQNAAPAPEECDGLDNDCDGTPDEGNPGGGGSCDTGLEGVCAAGTLQCSAGSLNCVQDVSPSFEVCDGLDNDCNGTPDDGGDSLCNDADGCTVDECTPEGCSFTPTSACDDGQLCTVDVCTSLGDTTFTCSNDGSLGTNCGGQCVDIQTDPNNCGSCNVACGQNQDCAQSVCVCEAGFGDCDGNPNGCETSLNTDPNNCGSCGIVCASGFCTDGVCVPE